MRRRFSFSTALIAGVALAAVFGLAAIRMTGQATRTARTADGHPNLNGIWQATTTAN